MKISRLNIRLQLAIALMVGIVFGCRPVVKTGELLTFPRSRDAVMFGMSSNAETFITNRMGDQVPGIILYDASFIQSPRDLVESRYRSYAIFEGFVLGNGARGRYWQQQSRRQAGLGLPSMDSRLSKVTVVKVNSNLTVLDKNSFDAAHVRLSVDTNDFEKPFPVGQVERPR